MRGLVGQAGIAAELDADICARAILRLSEEAGRMVLIDSVRFSPERYERFARTVMEMIWAGGGGALRGDV